MRRFRVFRSIFLNKQGATSETTKSWTGVHQILLLICSPCAPEFNQSNLLSNQNWAVGTLSGEEFIGDFSAGVDDSNNIHNFTYGSAITTKLLTTSIPPLRGASPHVLLYSLLPIHLSLTNFLISGYGGVAVI